MIVVDRIKLWLAALSLIASVYIAGYELGADQAAQRVGVLVAGLSLSTALFIFSQSGRLFFVYVRAAYVELQKVVWPSRQETIKVTGVVVLLVTLVMFFLWLVDLIISNLLGTLTS